MSDLVPGEPKASVDVDLTGYQLTPTDAPYRRQTRDEPVGLWLDGNGKVTSDPGRAVPPSQRAGTVTRRPQVGSVQAEVVADRPEAPVARTNTLAVLAFVFSLLGSAVVAVILGHIALKQIESTGEKSHGLALAGTVIGYVTTSLVVVIAIIGFATVAGS